MAQKIAFIGAGNMAEAIISGMLSKELYQPENIYVTNRSNQERLQYFKDTYNVKVSQDKKEVLENVETIIIAMKPKDIAQGLDTIRPYLQTSHLLISVIAGVSISSIQNLLNMELPIVRVMPNTSATIGKSASAICLGEHANDTHLQQTTALVETIGTVSVVEEEELHAVTGLSGSGPAYVYYLAEAMEKAAVNLGLDKEVAKSLVAQTIIGAGEMLKHSPKEAKNLRKDVMSPGGTTEAGIHVLEENQVHEIMTQCVETAAKRSRELGEELADKMLK